MAPLVVTPKVPLTVLAPNTMALASVRLTLLPEVMTAVLKSLALFNVMLLAAPAANVVVPVILKAPDCVMAPVVFTFKVPLTVLPPNTMALVSVTFTLLAELMLNVLKLLVPVVKVMLLPEPAVRVVAPVTAKAPDCVMAPLVLTPKVPLTVLAANIKALASVRLTLLPVVMPTELKSLALFKVISLAEPAASVVAPVTVKAPDWVMAPLEVTPKVPLTVLAPKAMALASVKETLLPEVMATVLKLLVPVVKVMLLPEPAAKVVVPVTAKAPDWVMAPLVVTPRVPLTVLAPSANALASVMLTLLPEVTATVLKSLVPVFKVILLREPAANIVVPVTANAPDWVIAPLEVMPKVPLTVLAPKIMALASVMPTLLPELMLKVLKLLALFKVMLLPEPAAKVVAPVTVNAPDWVMAPLVVTPKVPLTVLALNMMALVSVKETLLPEVIATVLKLLPALFRVISFVEPEAKVAVPVIAKAVKAA